MPERTSPLLTGALLAGAGAAGYLAARWLAADTTKPAATTAPSEAPSPPTSAPPASPARLTTPPRRPQAPAPRGPDLDGPVTSPDQVEPSPASAAGEPLPRTFDPILARHAAGLPLEYLRALAARESGLDPRKRGRAGWGLFQIIEVVRADFNRAHRTAITRAQLLDADLNTRIATWLLRHLVDSLHRNHPTIPNLRPDWAHAPFCELATFAWNAGFSEAGGVGRVVTYLEAKGARDVDLGLVHDHAATAGASPHLSNPAKVRWCRGVVALYLRERARAARITTAPVG